MKFLRRLQNKTEGERDRFVLVAALCITLCIVIAWFCFNTYFHKEKIGQGKETVQKIKQNIAESWQSMFVQ